MTEYTVVGLIDRTTNVLEIAGVFPGHHARRDRGENSETTRWSCHVNVADADEAETIAHYLHTFGGVPAEHRPTELTLGSVVVDENDRGCRVTLLSLDGDTVRVRFAGDDHGKPATFRTDATVRAVLTPVS